MRTKTLMAIMILAGALFLLLNPVSSKADTVSYYLGIPNTSGTPPLSSFTGPYATALVNRTDSTHATITFTSLTNNGNIYLLGDGNSVAVNVNATSWTLGTITGSNAGTGFTPGTWSNGGAGNVDGFGSMNQTIDSFDGFTHSSDMISFTITDTSGTWASAANVLVANAAGFLAGAHIFVTSSPADASNRALTTGDAVNGSVPEPGILILLGIAMSAVGVASRYVRKI